MIPILKTDNHDINTAFRMAIGDMYSNIDLFCDGLLTEEAPVMMAGAGYTTPWTRDAAINTWNCGGLIIPEVAKNTLMSVLRKEKGKIIAGGEYWDAIIWVKGAYEYYLYTGDEDFLKLCCEVTVNTIEYFEITEFDEELNLFRGPACYGDGVAAYPDIYAKAGEPGIIMFAKTYPELCSKTGEGNPMFTLSTNCLYYEAYKIAHILTGDEAYEHKAKRMKDSINSRFWNEKKGLYNYIIDPFGGSDYDEGLGQSFAIIFGVADEDKAQKIMENQVITPNGIPCVYPSFKRYDDYGIGRHSGTVWPHIQTFWAHAVAEKNTKLFENELRVLIKNVLRDGHFSELYHPETGERYGGVQEDNGKIRLWESEKRQMWCATGCIHMILRDLIGMKFTQSGIEIKPKSIESVKSIHLANLRYRNAVLNINIADTSHGTKSAFIPSDSTGIININL